MNCWQLFRFGTLRSELARGEYTMPELQKFFTNALNGSSTFHGKILRNKPCRSWSGKTTFLERGRLASLLAILLVFSVVICVWSSRYQQGVDSIIRLGRRGGASLIAHSHHY